MNLEEKLRQLKSVTKNPGLAAELERRPEYLRRPERCAKLLPAQRVPRGVEEYVEGRICRLPPGECFMAEQALPFGRPYGTLRIGDVVAASLAPLDMFLEGGALPSPERIVFLDTETTGLADSTDTCAFMIGLGVIESSQFVVRQYFLRDYAEERAALAAVTEQLESKAALVTFNGKTFDVPLLENRYSLHLLKSPFAGLTHLDLLHPARRLWKLRLESCRLTNLEARVLGIERDGDVPGSEIPGIYFDYLRTGDARGLQPVFFHNALDVISLAALAVEMARIIERTRNGEHAPRCSALDLLSLSRIFERTGESALSLSACARAIEAGLPEDAQADALWQLAMLHKRRGEFERAEQIWKELIRLDAPAPLGSAPTFRGEVAVALRAYRELAVHYERRQHDAARALEFTEQALVLLSANPTSAADVSGASGVEHFLQRRNRLKKRLKALAL